MKICDTKEMLLVSNTDLSRSSFTDVNLREAQFTYVNLSKAKFAEINLSDATFSEVNLANVEITDVNLREAQFTDVNLAKAKFADINLSDATFSEVNLANVEIKDCNLSGLKIQGVLVLELLKTHEKHRSTKEQPIRMNPYLHFNGQCEAAFKFYEQCLGGRIVFKMTYGESPMADKSPPAWRDKIMHARMLVKDQVLMGSDVTPDRYDAPKGFSMSLNLAEAAEAERIFNALVEQATVIMPLQQTFWAERFGMLSDQFGVPWMINCEKEGGAAPAN